MPTAAPGYHAPLMETSPSRRWIAFLLLAFLAGAVLRNAWLSDMEYKYDEKWMFDAARNGDVPDPWPWVGMRSGAGVANPGMSIWVFAAPARLLHLQDPVALARVVTIAATLAIGLFMLLAARRVPSPQREPWLWASALLAVNPGAVILQRKIWAQSVLPLLSVGALYGWWNRRTRWGAFLWGALGACLGQIHMSGLFYAAGIFLWTALFDRKPDADGKRIRWGSWALGSALTGWPLLLWASEVFTPGRESAVFRPLEILEARFYAHWGIEISGLHAQFSLGRFSFRYWLTHPFVAGHPTYLIGVALVATVALAVAALAVGLWSWWKDRASWRRRLTSRTSSALAQNGALLAFGGLISISGLRIYPHYLLVALPLVFLWLARSALCSPRFGRFILVGLFAGYTALSAGFLTFVHTNAGASDGDYGVSYSHQGH